MMREIHFIHPSPDGGVHAQVVALGQPWVDGQLASEVTEIEAIHRDPVFDRGMVNVPSTVIIHYGDNQKDIYRNAVIIRESYGEIQ